MKIGMRKLRFFILLFAASSLLFHPPSDFEAFAATSDGSVDSTVEINDETASLGLFNGDNFGTAVANIGDLDGDGVNDLVVGAYHDNAGGGAGTNRGAVHIIFMNTDGTVKSNVEINKTTTNGPSALLRDDNFGRSVANIGDLDGDGVNDLAVGAFEDDGGGTNRGAIYIIFMNTDGTVKSTKEISNSTTNGPNLNNHDHFGASVANIGDLDGDGVNDLAVGAHLGNTIHIMFMNTDGSVKSTEEINSTTENGPPLNSGDRFGGSVANIGDLDGDGVNDLAVGAFRDHNAAEGTGDGDDRGAIHIIFMNTDGTVKSTKEISNSTTNGPNLADNDQFGVSVANIGDLDGDGVNDLAVGAHLDDAGTGDNLGAVHIIFMNTDGTVKSIKEINDTTTNGLNLADNDQFGASVANIGDLDSNGVIDLAVGVWFDDTGTGNNLGAVHILFLHETTKPTVTITPSSGDCGDTVNSTTLSYTVTFSESTSNFVVGDITVTGTANGSSPAASNFAGSGTTYTFDVVKGSSDGTVIVSVAAGVATDAAGNDNTASDSCTFTIETVSPTVTITPSSGDCGDTVNSTTLSYTVTFSESTSNFVVGDITVTGTANGGSPEASNFAGSGTTYTFDVVKGTSDGTVLVSVAAGVATDAAGNDNTASDSCTFTIDTAGPTVTITSSTGDSGGTISSGTVRYTITFSSSVTGFTIGDITVTGTANGGSPAASNFAGSGTTYTFDVVRGSSGGTVTVKIVADVATDSDGNDNTISNTYELTVESLAFSSGCSKHTLLGNCGTISINNDVYRIAKNWNNFPATEVLVGDPVTIILSIPKKPTYTKISSASVYTEIFDSPKNYEQSSYIDYSPMNNKITYISQSQLFQVAGATHRIIQDPDVMNLDRFEVVFTMIFAKPMDTSHIVIETKNSSGFPEIIYLTNALKVSERPVYALTLEEQSKFELTYKPEIKPESDVKREIESEPDMKREIEPEPKGICGKGTVLKDNMCVSKEWSFFDFFEQLMKLFG